MRRTRLAWGKLKALAWGLSLCSFAFAEGDSLSVSSATDAPVAETSVAETPAAGNGIPSLDSLVAQVDSVNRIVPSSADSATPVAQPLPEKSSAPLKTVLYLGGGERAPWFQLGVLYAIEEYGIPVDSVVATSWGAWIGSLWSRGVPLDDIQKMMLDPAIAPFVGHDLSAAENRLGYSQNDPLEMPISVTGIPSVRQRFTLSVDSAHFLERRKQMLTPDSMQAVRALAKLRFQESLYRQRSKYRIPFSVQSCDAGNPVIVGDLTHQVIESLPLWNNPSGELCPYYAMPAEDNASEHSVIVVSDPLRAPLTGSPSVLLVKRHTGDVLASQPGVVIRAHTILDTSRTAWIQAGFTSFEKQLANFRVLNGRRNDYSRDRVAAKPWFRFEPTFDSLSSEVQNAVRDYWDKNDTGMVAPANFAYSLLQNPAYDSLDFDMQPGGNLSLEAAVHPTFDVAAGGFGSNAIGPNAYFEGSVHYVDHIEIELILAGFWGGNSYGMRPRLGISKLWNRHWNVLFGYDYLKLVPLKSFNNKQERSLRVESEKRSDLTMSIEYVLDKWQFVSLDFLLGSRQFELHPLYYGGKPIKTYPVSPMLHYRYLEGPDDDWFAENGYVLNVWGGFESIGFDDGIIDVVPIYWKILADARYTISPKPFVTFNVAAAGAIERYHDEGHGYVSPKSFEKAPLDVAYRQHAAATPWSTEWYNAELSSHEYAMLRLNGGLHGSYLGAWIFGAYYHDFERSPYARLAADKFVFEPAVRFAYRSFVVYVGMNRIVDKETLGDLTHVKQYDYFIRIGNYSF